MSFRTEFTKRLVDKGEAAAGWGWRGAKWWRQLRGRGVKGDGWRVGWAVQHARAEWKCEK